MSPRKLITHNGSFHADDIFAAATLSLYLESRGEPYEIIRTRDPKIIEEGDFVFDVGGVYNADNNRFDHHQTGGAGRRTLYEGGENGIEYASFGLVWKKFGNMLCGSEKATERVDKKLVAPIDANDNGIDLVSVVPENKDQVFPYSIQNAIFSMYPTWQENDRSDEVFLNLVKVAREILAREITHAKDFLLAQEIVSDIYNNTKDKRIIVLDNNYPYQETLQDFKEPLFVVYPRKTDGSWGVKCVTKELRSFENKKNLPAQWGGLYDTELQNITGVSDAVFCHKGLFMAVAKSKEGGVKLAELALKD